MLITTSHKTEHNRARIDHSLNKGVDAENKCRTVRAKVMKGQVILIISSRVYLLIDYCLTCGYTLPHIYI
jgi:hypothetical protein